MYAYPKNPTKLHWDLFHSVYRFSDLDLPSAQSAHFQIERGIDYLLILDEHSWMNSGYLRKTDFGMSSGLSPLGIQQEIRNTKWFLRHYTEILIDKLIIPLDLKAEVRRVKAKGVTTWSEYRKMSRVGLQTPLKAHERKALWSLVYALTLI